MANSNEIVQIEAISKSLASLNAIITQSAEKYMLMIKNIETGNAVINTNIQSQKALSDAQKETAKNTQFLSEQNKKMIAAEQKLAEMEAYKLQNTALAVAHARALNEEKARAVAAAKLITDAAKQEAEANKRLAAETANAAKEAAKLKAEQDKSAAAAAAHARALALPTDSLNNMREKLKALLVEYDKMTVRTPAATAEVNNLSRAIGEAEAATNRHQRGVGGYREQLGGLIPTASSLRAELIGMLPVAGIAMAGAAIVGIFKSIRDSSNLMSDTVEFVVAGLSGAMERFWTVVATGNWSNFLDGIGKAYTAAKELSEKLDEVADNQRALTMKEADWNAERILLLTKYRSELKTDKDAAIKTGEEILEKGKEMAAERVNVAEKEFKAYEKDASEKTGIDKERLKEIALTVDSEAKTRAIEYNEEKQRIEDLAKFNILYNGDQSKRKKEAAKLLSDLDSKTSDETKRLGADLIKFDKYQKEELQKKYVESYAKLKNAQVSADQENIRIAVQLAGAKDDIAKDATEKDKKDIEERQKRNKENFDKQFADVELINKRLIYATGKRHLDGVTNEERYQQELYEAESKGLEARLGLYGEGSKEYEAIAATIQDRKLKKADEAAKVLIDLEKITSDGIKEIQDKDNAEVDKAIKESIDLEVGATKKKNDLILTEEEKAAEAKIKLKKKVEDQMIETAMAGVNAIFEISSMKIDQEMADLQVEKDAKLSNAKLTTEQRAAIEADYTKKENEIKAKKAAQTKTQALFDIAIKTAVATVATLSETPLPKGLPLMLMTIAMGALQAGIVAARPIPKYAKGTSDAAEAGIFGEAGRELMITKKGKISLVNEPTYFEGSEFKGARIFSNPETEKLLHYDSAGGRHIQDERLINELISVRKAIQNKPVAIYSSNHKLIGQKYSTHQEIYINRLTR